MQNFYARQQIRFDLKILLSLVFLLTFIGLLFIYSSSCIFASEKFGTSLYFLKKQGVGLLLAIVAFCVCVKIPFSLLKKISFFFFIGSLLLTGLTLVPGLGRTIHGSCRWLILPGLAFQPSELLKISLFLYIAKIIENKRYKPFTFMGAYLPLLSIVGITMLVLLMQPDFGLAVTLFATFFSVLVIVQLNWKYILLTGAAVLPAAMVLILLKPYRVKRLFTYLDPWHDPQGAGFQIIQSLIAIGSGGFSGVGLSKSKQKFFYLPMQHTDFIFSIIAEEIGFLGSCVIIFLFMLFLYLGVKIALRLQSYYATLVILSFVILMSLQSMINIGVASGLLPTKGIGLPFVSYGNSCLISSFAMMGIIANAVLSD